MAKPGSLFREANPDYRWVVFHCKDLVITKYVQMKYSEQFNRWIDKAQSVGGRDIALRKMHQELASEAKRQKWYDYYEQGDGLLIPHERVVIRDANGDPVILVPWVTIESNKES